MDRYDTIATVVFSHPPIGTIGLTEAQAAEEFGAARVKTKFSRFPSMAYAMNPPAARVKTGLKLVLRLPEERVVGLHCIGPFSDEMLQGFAVAVRMGATRMDFEASVAIHPTIAEEFVTFSGWGQSKDKDPVTGAEIAEAKAKPYIPPYLRPEAARGQRGAAGGKRGGVLGFALGVVVGAGLMLLRARR